MHAPVSLACEKADWLPLQKEEAAQNVSWRNHRIVCLADCVYNSWRVLGCISQLCWTAALCLFHITGLLRLPSSTSALSTPFFSLMSLTFVCSLPQWSVLLSTYAPLEPEAVDSCLSLSLSSSQTITKDHKVKTESEGSFQILSGSNIELNLFL